MVAAYEIRKSGFSCSAVTISAKMIAEKCDPLGDSYEKCDIGTPKMGISGGVTVWPLDPKPHNLPLENQYNGLIITLPTVERSKPSATGTEWMTCPAACTPSST